MSSKTVRYQPHINAPVVLERFVVEEWTTTEQRGLTSKTRDNITITVFPEAMHIKVSGTLPKVDKCCKSIEDAFGIMRDTVTLEDLLDSALVHGTRKYIESIVLQINLTYNVEAYDAAAVLIRRLVETMIIELFEAKNIAHKIMNVSGDIVPLSELVAATIKESDSTPGAWHLGRNTKKGLADIKTLGDLSAHNRRFLARKTDISRLKEPLRVVVEELITLTGYTQHK